jgi:hypothetical protein
MEIGGSLDLYLGRERRHRLLKRGDSATAIVGQLHTFANDREQAAIIQVETRPAGDIVRAFQLAYRVAKKQWRCRGWSSKKAIRPAAVHCDQREIRASSALLLQGIVFGAIVLAARVAGVEGSPESF